MYEKRRVILEKTKKKFSKDLKLLVENNKKNENNLLIKKYWER